MLQETHRLHAVKHGVSELPSCILGLCQRKGAVAHFLPHALFGVHNFLQNRPEPVNSTGSMRTMCRGALLPWSSGHAITELGLTQVMSYLTVRASAFFLSSACPLTAPTRRAFITARTVTVGTTT